MVNSFKIVVIWGFYYKLPAILKSGVEFYGRTDQTRTLHC